MPRKKRKTKKSTKKTKDFSKNVSPSFSTFQTIKKGRMSALEESNFLNKSSTVRSDYGRPIDIRIPYGYHSQVKKAWEMYDTDSLFKYLVNRCIDFGANGFEWELPAVYSPGVLKKILNKLGKKQKEVEKVRKEEEVWNTWASTINQEVPNVISGMDEINKWIFKHLLISGMAPLGWTWKKVTINGVKYELPLEMTVWNPLSIALKRKDSKFISEEAYLKTSQKEWITEKGKVSDIFSSSGASSLNIMGQGKRSDQEAFILKYNWSPGDNTSLILGRNVSVGQGLYPSPPFLGLIEPVNMRRQLYAADISILDGIINYLIVWKIGDNTKDADGNLIHEPLPETKDASGATVQKSSLEIAKEIITAENRGNAMQIFLPYYWDLDIKIPQVESLLNTEKYMQPTNEILSSFGIFVAPSGRTKFPEININNFEEMLDNVRLMHIRRFWESLCREIVKRNKGKLTIVPNMVFNPLNTQTEAFRSGLLQLSRIGRISAETLLKAFRADKKTEISRIAGEQTSGEKKLMEENVPTSFKQAVTQGGQNKELKSSEGPGRPSKEGEEE